MTPLRLPYYHLSPRCSNSAALQLPLNPIPFTSFSPESSEASLSQNGACQCSRSTMDTPSDQGSKVYRAHHRKSQDEGQGTDESRPRTWLAAFIVDRDRIPPAMYKKMYSMMKVLDEAVEEEVKRKAEVRQAFRSIKALTFKSGGKGKENS
ncbi:hypothetical protein H6P81_010422 [Aristolochia fimbriata]|uniref:Uncharacterized protein n=1 Tax=Aristolochia fimbriata TaxID=158543 RepID=A0AAV7ENR2_ARIFI|nr:hypothetical protein H6P81_010422 [Aristolochia fimbriata]